jgi:hypothetical protein
MPLMLNEAIFIDAGLAAAHRHCERSEAIQWAQLDCRAASLLSNEGVKR